MSIEETKKIVDKIKIFRPTFGGNFDKAEMDRVKLEWHRILEAYDYEDVTKSLDEYFQNSDNFGRYPDAYYLIKYLKKHDDKLKANVNYVRCQMCGEVVDLEDYDKHCDRCGSIDYLCRMSEKYYFKKLNREKLLKLSDTEFENKYWIFCEKLYDDMKDTDALKHSLKNAILTHYGHEPEYTTETITEEIKNEIKQI